MPDEALIDTPYGTTAGLVEFFAQYGVSLVESSIRDQRWAYIDGATLRCSRQFNPPLTVGPGLIVTIFGEAVPLVYGAIEGEDGVIITAANEFGKVKVVDGRVQHVMIRGRVEIKRRNVH